MLLIHQVGSVKIGEVIRYTVTYTPSQDRILPSPDKLHVRVRNTSSIALRAAFVHGPYTLSVAAYPSNFDPNVKFDNPRRYGIPEFEPLLKAGGSWECELVVPDTIRQAAGAGPHGGFGKSPDHDGESATWILEVSSQVIFSTSAAVGYDIVVARDQKSLSLTQSLPVVGSQSQVPQPGKVTDLQQGLGAKDHHHAAQPKGVFSRAVHVTVEDTAALWNTPRLPTWDDSGHERVQKREDTHGKNMVHADQAASVKAHGMKRQKKVHLVILTHGIHSSLGADLLYMKESIDAAAREAKIAARARRSKRKMDSDTAHTSSAIPAISNGNTFGEDGSFASRQRDEGSDDEDEDEEIIVRGFPGNATKTEKGIKYLGKRLARYVLSVTYPDQPFLPIGKGAGEGLLDAHKREETTHFVHQHQQDPNLKKAHKHSTIHADENLSREEKKRRPYKVTSISFVGHSLGGLVQTYSVAYIQKHSPQFFSLIKPINFVALASPFLGLSNENPLYVRFALDFGLVGRTGQDLGLTWRAPTIARSGWGAIVGNLGESAHKRVYGETQPESKPLLRILPTGPAHTALRKFRNRTVYSNVVNDGIVPLRTSCLLFLDWQGLGRVEKARRDAGLVETVVGFGWAELTGTNMANNRQRPLLPSQQRENDSEASSAKEEMRQVPQPSNEALHEDDRASLRSAATPYHEDVPSGGAGEPHTGGPLSGFFNFFRSNEPPKAHPISQKQKLILRRGQTMPPDQSPADSQSNSEPEVQQSRPAKATSGHELEADPSSMLAPPKTTFFESAGDLLNPSKPPVEFILDPAKRPRTIFHDRVYHPADIPPTPMRKRPSTFLRRKTFDKASGADSPPTTTTPAAAATATTTATTTPRHTDTTYSTNGRDDSRGVGPGKHNDEVVDNLRVEEKIARGYHRDLSWRKVLVKLEPDAHNNIIVRRMFANAFGWPVVKHLVDAHFSDSAIARMRDDDEPHGERALDMNLPPDAHGGETKAFASLNNGGNGNSPDGAEPKAKTEGEAREALDEVPDLPTSREGEPLPTSHATPRPGPGDRADSVTWSERDWADSENETDGEKDAETVQKQERRGSHLERLNPSSPSSWNWAEKIVGKGARGRSKSPGQRDGEGSR